MPRRAKNKLPPGGKWDCFLSHTQRDGVAVTIASTIYYEMRDRERRCWLNVMMGKCDVAAMEEGVRNSKCLIAIVTDNGHVDFLSELQLIQS
eukprot:SAG22_NODE_1240_length_5042_cov_103.645964_2_plen_92_part_00